MNRLVKQVEFSQEELREIGLIKDEEGKKTEVPQQQTNPQNPENPNPNPEQNPNVQLADAIAKLTERINNPVSGDKKEETDPTEKMSLEELVAAGEIEKALQRVKADSQAGLGSLVPLVAEQAKTLFRNSLGEKEFDFWYPYIQRSLSLARQSESAFVSQAQWNELLNYVKSQNLDIVTQRIREEERSKLAGSIISSGSQGNQSFHNASVRAGLAPEEASIARDLGMDPKKWAGNRKIIEKYVDHVGDVVGAPLVNNDLVDRDNFGDVIVKPGRF